MKPVVQEEITGCAIASVAALAGVSYANAKKVANSLGIFAEDSRLWSHTDYIRTLLNHYQIQTANSEYPFISWEELPDLALLATKWHLEKRHHFGIGRCFGAAPVAPLSLIQK